MEIFELAAELGRTLKKDKRLVALEEARIAYEKDAHIAALMTEYEVQQKALQDEAVKAERDQKLIDMIEARVDAIYREIVGSEAYLALEKAQNEVNELMNAVNTTITTQITGEQPSSCTHNCATCGGCH